MSANPTILTPDDRRHELARIFARGLRRLLRPRASDALLAPQASPEKLSEFGEVCLEVDAETRLSVSRVDASQNA